MCSYRARRNFKGEKTTTSVGPNLLPAIRIDSGSTSTENSTAEFGLFMNLHKSWQNAVTAEVGPGTQVSDSATYQAPTVGDSSGYMIVAFHFAFRPTYTLGMNRPVLVLGLVVELMASFLMRASAPSDSYPSIRNFLVQHAIIWAFTLAAAVALANATLAKKLPGSVQAALACLIAELVSTCLMWLVIPSDFSHLDQVCREWFGFSGFWNYFLRRLLGWLILAAIALLVYCFRPQRIPGTNART
jgi:hypothetical protein